MDHTVKVTAQTPDAIKSAADASGASSFQYFPVGQGYIGLIKVGALSQRHPIRKHPDVDVIPSHSSTSDVAKHAKKLGLANIKTARDFHAAVFAVLDLDELDPDL